MKDEATENSNESICRWTVHCRAFEIFHLVEVSQSKEIVNLLLPDQVCHQNYHRISRELSSSSLQFHSRLDCPVSMKKTSLLSIKGLEEIVKKRDLSYWRFGLIFSPSVCRVFVFVFSSTKLRNTVRHYSRKNYWLRQMLWLAQYWYSSAWCGRKIIKDLTWDSVAAEYEDPHTIYTRNSVF